MSFVHTFAGNPLDRADIRRRDPDWLARAAADPASRYLPFWQLNVLIDGAGHSVESSDLAFQLASRSAFREAYERSKPVVLEPIIRVDIEGPSLFLGAYI